MAVTKDDFEKIWASTSPLTPYSFSESNYKEGWNFIGGTPPARQMWDFLQKQNDEKSKFLLDKFGEYLPLSGGTITGVVNGVTPPSGDNSTKIATTEFVNAKAGNYLPLSGGTLTGDVNGVTPPAGDNSKKIANTEFVQALAKILVPTGCVQAYAGNTTPQGWLLCDGSAVSRTNYADLYAVIGTTYGAGNGSTTFNLPNLTDKFIQGNATAGTVKSAGLPNITGSFETRYPWPGAEKEATGAFKSPPTSGATDTQAGASTQLNYNTVSFSANKSNSIYGNSSTVQPPALTMRYIIKY